MDLGFSPTVTHTIMSCYMEDHRFYHNWGHIEDLLDQLKKRDLLGDDILFLAAIFHDIVYDPKASDNEERSAKAFSAIYKKSHMEEVAKIILETKTHKPTTELSKIFCEMDLDILSRPLDKLIEYENQIFKEYQFVDWKTYQVERVKVLRSLQKTNELESLISYVESRKPNIGVYAGSFNPFHKGHYDVLMKAEDIFDKVIIAQGFNPEKSPDLVKCIPSKLEYRQIETYQGLLTDFINGLGYDVTLIRGLRNSTDLQYEITQYRFLQDMKPDLKMISIFCNKEYEHVSSSAIRQLKQFGKDERYLL